MRETEHEVKLLVFEETDSITQAKNDAKERASALNAIADFFYFETKQEFTERTKDMEAMKRVAILKDKEIQKLSKHVDLSAIKIPAALSKALDTLERLINTYAKSSYEFTLFDNIANDGEKWVIDEIEFNRFAETHRYYATTDFEIEKFKIAKSLADFQNKHRLGNNFNRADFVHAFLSWDGINYGVHYRGYKKGSELNR